ncbi:Splicing factor 45 [Frankliniella fusca]|uniref:Splicing factor 45 n=1 Tax=Frankliniella fusca TaxID=407009 RepID=A0AAE1L6W5_9NEOP|nr:Splicing factor 45 [Frankliniella fusca]KAK3911183.1 Splicing factor 45 [Frankliniella fusca]
MSLYDDVDAIKQKNDQVAGWSSGIKLFQSQLQLKKATQTQPKRDITRKLGAPVLPPVIDLKTKKDDDDIFGSVHSKPTPMGLSNRDDWQVEGEYDPMWPNDYEKVVIELKEKREREKLKEEDDRRKRRGEIARPRDARLEMSELPRPSEEEEEDADRMANMGSTPRTGGAAIAPPPSLQEPSPQSEAPPGAKSVPSFGGGSVAAKIMAKFGYKEGQGLGKKEQGIAMALQVEKTSKRGGRIIHEKDMMPPPLFAMPTAPVSAPQAATSSTQPKPEPSITEIMREPSKVVLLRNMVGPGEVDDDLEPEVKDECNTKYGEVVKVVIYEIPHNPADEAVRIFVEFKRMESAIKAVVDLNGRFFGGRQVKAGFYSWDRLQSLQLLD